MNTDVRGGLQAEIAARWSSGTSKGRRFRVGLVGCGRIARSHAAAITQHPACELVAVCDPVLEARAGFGSSYDVPAERQFASYREMLQQAPLDTVHICTWPDTHAEITIAAAGAGVHVYCEKPMALDLAQCDAMLAAARQAGIVLAIGHHRRGDSRYLRARQLIEEGAIGTLRRLKGDHGGGSRRMMAMSTHLYDLFRFLAGDVAWASGAVLAQGREATADDVYTIPHEGLAAGDEVAAQFQFRNGVYAFHDGLGHVDVELCGTHGRMIFYEGAARKPWPFGEVRAAWARYPGGDYGRGGQHAPASWEPLDGVPIEELVRTNHAYARMIDRFLRAVEGDGQPLCTGEDGRASIEMALAVYASHFSGCRAPLPLGITHPLSHYPAPERPEMSRL